ncbi:MAG TPA: HD domain-containing protein [Methylomirabilota bacterium]|nr:HD domain-containing protein [Methylomirabilota bacterium]
MKNKVIENLLQFYINAEKLKTTIRHSYTSDRGRMESSAEHSWMLCLIAMTLFEHLKTKIDQLKVLKMVVLHDLAEAVTGDIPAFEISDRQNAKKENELVALEHLTENLSKKTREEFLSLWKELEEKKTSEAKVAQAIDKLEAVLQHNISHIETWDQNDYDIHPFYRYDYFKFDDFFLSLREVLEVMSRKKITDARQLSRLKDDMRKIYEDLNKKEL